MAGTLFGLPKSTVFDASGDLARGALLYIYAENTSTPSTTYSDFGLTTSQVWPLAADAAGRLPTFWLADGNYRARLTTSTGVEIFDDQSITAIGASSGAASSGSSSQDTSTLFQAGDLFWTPGATTRTGWVRANGRTIGSGSSGGTERANGDTQSLFEFLWTNFSDSVCAVSSGRGASAAADFNANKTITLLDMRGRTGFGADDMGNSAASRLTAGTPTAQGSTAGAEKQTIATANLPSHTHGAGTFAVGTSITNGTVVFRTNSVGNTGTAGANTSGDSGGTTSTLSLASGSVSGTSGSAGSGTALATTPPYLIGYWFIKL